MEAAEIDLFKFFIDKAYAENTLLYTRSAVFTSLLAIMAGFALKELALTEKRSYRTKGALVLVALLGIGISVAWYFVNQKSMEYVHSWQRDAYRVAAGSEIIKKNWKLRWQPRDPAEEHPSALAAGLTFWEWRPSTWYKALASMFGAFWVALLVYGLFMSLKEVPVVPPTKDIS